MFTKIQLILCVIVLWTDGIVVRRTVYTKELSVRLCLYECEGEDIKVNVCDPTAYLCK